MGRCSTTRGHPKRYGSAAQRDKLQHSIHVQASSVMEPQKRRQTQKVGQRRGHAKAGMHTAGVTRPPCVRMAKHKHTKAP